MKQILDFIPILLFFGAYKFADIYVATGVLMVATIAQMSIIYYIDRKLQMMHKLTLGLVLGFGALTLGFHDERFIKIKPSVLYLLLGGTLGIALWGFGKNFLHMMLGAQIKLPQAVWRKLTAAWVAYALFMAAVNGFVAWFYTTEQWVNFKIWGYAFPLAFLVAQGLYIAKYMEPSQDES